MLLRILLLCSGDEGVLRGSRYVVWHAGLPHILSSVNIATLKSYLFGESLRTIRTKSSFRALPWVELGSDFSKFRSAGAFSSWMGLCPDNDISGGKVLWSGTRKVKNRVAVTLRMAAQSLQQSESALGEFYRRMRA